MNMQDHDDDFDLRLSKRERLLPQFDAELDGPDADTDRLLIARARGAAHPVQLRSPGTKTFRGPRWAVPVALAATLVLSFTLLLHSDPGSVSAPVTAVTETAVSETAVSEAAVSEAAMNDAPSDASAQVVPQVRRAGQAEAPGASTDSAFDALPAEVRIEPSMSAKAMPATPAPAAAPAPPPPAMVADAASADVAVLGSAAPAARGMAETITAAESMAATALQREEGAPLDPEAWLRRIERLQSRGLEADARLELLAFRQQYPDHPLPAALQALLPAP